MERNGNSGGMNLDAPTSCLFLTVLIPMIDWSILDDNCILNLNSFHFYLIRHQLELFGPSHLPGYQMFSSRTRNPRRRSPTPTTPIGNPSRSPSPNTQAPNGNPLYLCSPFADAALVKGNFKTIVMLPKYVDIMEWVAVNSKFDSLPNVTA